MFGAKLLIRQPLPDKAEAAVTNFTRGFGGLPLCRASLLVIRTFSIRWVHKKLTSHLNPEAPSHLNPDTRKTIQATVAIRPTAATARTESSRIGPFRGSLTA